MLGLVKSAGAFVFVFVLAALVTSAPVLAQNWIKVPPPAVPRTADGKPNLCRRRRRARRTASPI